MFRSTYSSNEPIGSLRELRGVAALECFKLVSGWFHRLDHQLYLCLIEYTRATGLVPDKDALKVALGSVNSHRARTQSRAQLRWTRM